MKVHMLGGRNDKKVLDAIICLDAVAMMHEFFSE